MEGDWPEALLARRHVDRKRERRDFERNLLPRRLLVLAIVLSTLASAAHAEWATDGVAVCTASGEQVSPALVPDAAGGSILIWEDTRNVVRNIFAQRVNASGASLWANDGVAVAPFGFNQLTAQLVDDGAGGVIIVWEDIRHGVANKDIYVQRVDASGTPRWTAVGVAICLAEFDQSAPKIVSDEAGGAILAWTDNRNNGDGDIYAQRINASGTPLWGTDGVVVCSVETTQGGVELTADGAGGAIIAWVDFRNSAVTGRDLYAQRLNAAGQSQWTVDGVPVCTATGNQNRARMIADGAGGAFLTWFDDRVPNSDIYAQRLSTSGAALWALDGIPVCAAAGYQLTSELTSDRADGAIIAWQDSRSGNSDVYAQRVDGNGDPQWDADGVAIAATSIAEAYPTLVSLATGDVAIAWQEVNQSGETDIYANRLSSTGSIDPSGTTVVCGAPRNQSAPRLILDGDGGTLIAWNDARDRSNDIYAQRFDNPTAITLLDFTAAAGPEGVGLDWRLSHEALAELAGVHVQRAADIEGPWVDLATLAPSPAMSYVDFDVASGQTYWYRLLLQQPEGLQTSVALQVTYSAAGLRTALHPPLETGDGVVLRYSLAVAGQPRLEILDILGRRIQVLEPGMRPPGEHLVAWDRNSVSGTRVARGVYIVHLQVGAAATSRKMVLSR